MEIEPKGGEETMWTYSERAFAYVKPEMKERLRKIRETDREWTESTVLNLGLERIVPEIEKALGIGKSAHEPRTKVRA
jgi:hypothetical protein